MAFATTLADRYAGPIEPPARLSRWLWLITTTLSGV